MKKSLLLIALLLSGNVFASTVKWVDEHGKTHYSDQAPKHINKVETVTFKDTGGTPVMDNPYGKKSTQEMEADFQRGKAAREKVTQKEQQDQENAKSKQANCTVARNNLKLIEQSQRMYKLDAAGERVYMDDSQRQQQLEAAQKAINENCN